MSNKIVLAYSGGLDTSVLLRQFVLAGHEVIALTADLGESDAASGNAARAHLEAAREKALALGAAHAVVIDAKEEFVQAFAFKALAANALYESVYPLSAALSRPLIAKLLVETAHRFGAGAVAHGCTGKGNDQVRIELGVTSLDPTLTCRAPLRERPLSRPDALAFAAEHGIAVLSSVEKPYSIDANLWGRSIEAGVLEDPWQAPPQDAYAWTASPAQWPPSGEEITIAFSHGVPTLDGCSGAVMVGQLNVLAGKHGIGRIDLIEDRVVGLKSREVYECPGSITLIEAHKTLERLVLTRDELRFKAQLDQKYAELIYDGLWTSPLREALDAFNASLSSRMHGEVRMRLQGGRAIATGVRSPYALYNPHLATYGAGDQYDHTSASGFIKLHGLPLEVLAKTSSTTLVPA